MRLHALSAGLVLALAAVPAAPLFAQEDKAPPPDVQMTWGVSIPMRDGVNLNGTLYRAVGATAPEPCVFTLTPYISASYHDRGMYFAANGYVFMTVDVRGRGNSGGTFTPMLQEAKDGHDIVEWFARQPYCNGKVTMWGGSYAGYNQWATAKEFPKGLGTIVPVASPKPGVDYPMRSNLFYGYDVTWLTLVSGKAAQDDIFGDGKFWASNFRRWYTSHAPFATLDSIAGLPSPIFQEWISHPTLGPYWDAFNPTGDELAKLELPILSVTGQYDGDQPGALALYDDHMRHGTEAAKAKHFLVIGPWDHSGTRTPRAEVGGVTFGKASLVDMNALHKAWYDWTLKDGTRPEFLKDRVAFYVSGEEAWRYAPTLEAVTASTQTWYLDSVASRANDVFASGSLVRDRKGVGKPDSYVSDPLDTRSLRLHDGKEGGGYLVDQRAELLGDAPRLVYHTAPFEADTDLAGFFKLSAWIEIDQPDTDFQVDITEIKADGSSLALSKDVMRARYRESLHEGKLVKPGAIERYDFHSFDFMAQRIAKGSRLRLVISPINSMYFEKNYNAGGVVAQESGKDARKVRVRLYHDARRPSALVVPIAAKSSVPAKP